MADDGYDSMDAEAEREWHRKRGEGRLREALELPPCSSLFDPEEEPEEPEQHEITWVMGAESAHPIEGLCSCGERIEVARP